ncbi:MAG: hypothetical protein IT458_02990 [Planctomycetes bacterium]|nr:hypothetical protein [Planctomycetota bacterium]
MRTPLFLVLSSLFALTACGGGGSGGSMRATDPGLTVLFDTAAGPGADLDAIVTGLVLERPDGSSTANLVEPGGVALRFADPQAMHGGLHLREVPEGEYVAMHVTFLPESARQRRPDGRQDVVDLAQATYRIAFEDAYAHRRGGPGWLRVGHCRELDLARDPGGRVRWRQDLCGRRGDLLVVHEGRFEVARVDVPGSRLEGRLRVFGKLVPFTIQVTLRTEIERKLGGPKEPLAKDAFFRIVRPGDWLEVEGRIEGNVLVASELELRRKDARDPANLVYGRVVSVDAPNLSFGLQVLAVRENADAMAGPALPVMVVDAREAEIRGWNSKSRLGFEAIVVGAMAEVEWEGVWASGPVLAREIRVVTQSGGGCSNPELQGYVSAVDVQQGTLTLVPRGNDAFYVGGRRVIAVKVILEPGTYLYRDERGRGRDAIGLDQVGVGERAWVVGTPDAEGRIVARWIRVRSD